MAYGVIRYMSYHGLLLRRSFPTPLIALLFCLAGCSSGGGSSKGDDSTTNTQPPTMQPAPVQEPPEPGPDDQTFGQGTNQQPVVVSPKTSVTGVVTYDRVPFIQPRFGGLDYNAIISAPVRGVTVQALDSNDEVLLSTQTNNEGQYSFSVDNNTAVKIRVIAELLSTQPPEWNMKVRDNTGGDAIYILEGALVSVGDSGTQNRDLHAQSGWGGADYEQARSAAPFAILDSIYDAVMKIVSADASVFLPELDIYWSTRNISSRGSFSEGDIGTSFYTSVGPSIYLLGAKDNDTDEYDRAVVQHEFGHYVEHQLSRSESIGGSHSQTSALDMRVAFGEAWGNAFAAMVSDDPLYRDSLGERQSFGFTVDVEAKSSGGNQGWFSEASLQTILYDLYDTIDDGNDRISLGYKAIHDVLIDQDYLGFDGFASIYSFIHRLKDRNSNLASEISELVESHEIYGVGLWGMGETNNAGSNIVLPIYSALSPNGSVQVCSDNTNQEYNGVENRRFIMVTIPEANTYTFTASRSGGNIPTTNPDLRLFDKGRLRFSGRSRTQNTETFTILLAAGVYTLEIFEQANVDNFDSSGGLACFEVTIN